MDRRLAQEAKWDRVGLWNLGVQWVQSDQLDQADRWGQLVKGDQLARVLACLADLCSQCSQCNQGTGLGLGLDRN